MNTDQPQPVRLEYRSPRTKRWMSIGEFRSLKEAMQKVYEFKGNAEWAVTFLESQKPSEGLFKDVEVTE